MHLPTTLIAGGRPVSNLKVRTARSGCGAFPISWRQGLETIDALKIRREHMAGGFEQRWPHLLNHRRFVDNGKVVCSAGIAAGIDMSLHLVRKLLGQEWPRKRLGR